MILLREHLFDYNLIDCKASLIVNVNDYIHLQIIIGMYPLTLYLSLHFQISMNVQVHHVRMGPDVLIMSMATPVPVWVVMQELSVKLVRNYVFSLCSTGTLELLFFWRYIHSNL